MALITSDCDALQSEEQLIATRAQFDDRMGQLQKLFSQRDTDFEEKMRTKFGSQDTRIDAVMSSLQVIVMAYSCNPYG